MDFVNEAFMIAEDIVDNVNVYELICTPGIEAVEALEEALKEEESWIL